MNEKEYIKLDNELNIGEIKEHNKELILMFPWLKINDEYTSTWLDFIPEGWRITFGISLCKDINSILDNFNCVNNFSIQDMKEKYGSLRLYFYIDSINISKETMRIIYDELDNIIDKYEKLSTKICQRCGKPATRVTSGWISYLCDNCYNKIIR